MSENLAQRFCAKCETPLGQEMKFCRNCGAPVQNSQSNMDDELGRDRSQQSAEPVKTANPRSEAEPQPPAEEGKKEASTGFTLTHVVVQNPEPSSGSSGYLFAQENDREAVPDTEPVMLNIAVPSNRPPALTSNFVSDSTGMAGPSRPTRRSSKRFNRYLVLASLLSALFIAVFGAGLLTYKYIGIRRAATEPTSVSTPPPLPASTATASGSAAELLAGAKTDLQAGKAGDAIEKLDRAIQLDGNNAEQYKVRGDALTASSRYSEAIESYRQAIAHNNIYLDAYRDLAKSYEQLGQDDQAIDVYKTALSIKSEEAGLRLQLARALQRRGRLDEARKNYDQVAASPDEQLAAIARQEISRLNNQRAVTPGKPATDPTAAAPTATPAQTKPPVEPPVESPKPEPPKPAPPKPAPPHQTEPALTPEQYISRGTKLYNDGDPAGAIKEYQNALKRQPDNANVHYLIGLAYERMGNNDAALDAYGRCQSGPYASVARNHVEMLQKKLHKK